MTSSYNITLPEPPDPLNPYPDDIQIEDSPEAGLLFQTANYLSNGVPIPPDVYFEDYRFDIENASGEFRLKLAEVFQNYGIDPGELNTFDQYIAALTSAE